MQIEVPKGIEIEAVRYPENGEVTFSRMKPDGDYGQPLTRIEDAKSFGIVPILRPAAGYEFVRLYNIDRTLESPLVVAKKYEQPKCFIFKYWVTNSFEEAQVHRYISNMHPPPFDSIHIDSSIEKYAAVSETTGQLAAQ